MPGTRRRRCGAHRRTLRRRVPAFLQHQGRATALAERSATPARGRSA